MRELTGGIYFGERGRMKSSVGSVCAYDTECYSEDEVIRIGCKAFELAAVRRRNLVSVDKANVLESSRLWREVMHGLAERYPDVRYRDLYVDNAAMQLVSNPSDFDVVVLSNLFGDILTDEASAITGSIGLIPSASVGDGTFGLYEPIHGSAPDIAGKNIANPVASILSAAMLLRHSFSLDEEAKQIEDAAERAIRDGARTKDLTDSAGDAFLSTREMTEAILSRICG
ncbi:3-isopropylmalate dehydrogenase [bioreactor metagenome]|uniref:3-isopropylmalate dehydrogenase n=1 Tax=bioreactor metagenome TaxID=1076179 RepID=A0A645F586_9ZZZZ